MNSRWKLKSRAIWIFGNGWVKVKSQAPLRSLAFFSLDKKSFLYKMSPEACMPVWASPGGPLFCPSHRCPPQFLLDPHLRMRVFFYTCTEYIQRKSSEKRVKNKKTRHSCKEWRVYLFSYDILFRVFRRLLSWALLSRTSLLTNHLPASKDAGFFCVRDSTKGSSHLTTGYYMQFF